MGHPKITSMQNFRVVPELEIMTVIHPSTTKCIIVNNAAPVQRPFLLVARAKSLLHLPPKFSVTFTFTITGTEFGNSVYDLPIT